MKVLRSRAGDSSEELIMTTTVDKSIAAILSDMKEELKDFIRTRIELFKDEFQEKLKYWSGNYSDALAIYHRF
jgi:hypothetical protein